MATVSSGHEPLLRGWREELEQASEEARRLTEDLSPLQLRWRPAERAWSIGQVFEHLADSNASYLGRIREAIDRGRNGRGAGQGEWRPSFLGRHLIRTMDPQSRRRLPTPKIWRPGPEPRPDAVEAFLRTQRELAELMRSAEGVDLARARTSSPVSRLIRLNLGDCFQVLVLHAQRHLGQVRRIRESEGFPRDG